MRAVALLLLVPACDFEFVDDARSDTDDVGSCPSGLTADAFGTVTFTINTLDRLPLGLSVDPGAAQSEGATLCMAPGGTTTRLLLETGGVPAGRIDVSSPGAGFWDVAGAEATVTIRLDGLTENASETVNTWFVGGLNVTDAGTEISLSATGLGGYTEYGKELTLAFSVAAAP